MKDEIIKSLYSLEKKTFELLNDYKVSLQSERDKVKALEKENERLTFMLDKLSNGEAMNVIKESEGVYSVIFKSQILK